MGELVPIDKLPPWARALVRPGTPAFAAYAQQLEAEHRLPPGSLSDPKMFKLSKESDALNVLQRAAVDMRANPMPEGAAKPASAVGSPAGGRGAPALRELREFNPTDDMSGPERFAAGAGKSLVDTVGGVAQIIHNTPALQAALDEHRKLSAPLMETGAGMAGNMMGAVAQTVVPGKVLATGARGAQLAVQAARAAGKTAPLAVRASALGPVAQGAVVGGGFNAAQPVATGESRALNAVEGAVAGGLGTALPAAVGAAFRPAAESAGKGVQEAVAAAQAQKIPLRAAQISGNPWLQWVTAGLDLLPFGSGKALKGVQQAAFNRALARAIGQDTEDASAAMAAARQKLGSTYNDIQARNPALQLEPWHVDALQDTIKGYSKLDVTKGKMETAQLKALLQTIVNSTDPSGVIDSATYKVLRSKIGTLANEAKDATYKGALGNYQKVLDKAYKSGLSAEDAALLDLTDKQWGNMRSLEQIAPKDASGDFDFNKLPSVLAGRAKANTSNRNALLYGSGDQTLPDLAKIAPLIGRGPGGGTPAASPLMALGKKALAPAEVFAIGGGLYGLNRNEDNPFSETAADLVKVLAASKALGSANNSQWFARGVPAARAVADASLQGGLGQLGTAYTNAAKGRVPLPVPNDADNPNPQAGP